MTLTRLKLTRGEGQLVETSSQLSRRRTIHSPQVSSRHSLTMDQEESHKTLTSDSYYKSGESFIWRKNAWLQGESSNPPKGNEGNGDKTPKGNGRNGDTPPPSPPSSTSSTLSQPYPNSPNQHGKTPLLKIDIKFELSMYNGEVNAKRLDNWVHHIEAYWRIQRIQDDETKIQLSSLRLEGESLIWW